MSALCLSFDADWAADFVLADVLEHLQAWGVSRGTLFVTHDTAQNVAWQAAGFELGVHPNFNSLFDGETMQSTDDIISAMQALVPEARSVRCHGLTRSGVLSQRFLQAGYTHESNLMLPLRNGNRLQPFYQPPGLLQVPFGWGDYDHLASNTNFYLDNYFSQSGLQVFNFHPIHIYLNCETVNRYMSAKEHMQNRKKLEEYRFKGVGGVANFLQALIARAKRESRELLAIADIRANHV
jgi:hypothetical protein